MATRPWLRMSLAQKVSLLFGTAVLLVIAVTLWSPWLQMTSLHHQTMLLRAERVAGTALQAVDLHRGDWDAAQAELAMLWPELAREVGLDSEVPTFVPIGPQPPRGFRKEAFDCLAGKPSLRYYWKLQNDRRVFRFALAVRGVDADPHPQAVLGIIDVRLPMPEGPGVWNSVVTVLAGASGALLAILVFYVVTHRLVLLPVNELRRAAERVAMGDMSARTSIKTGDEFQKLSATFNDMLSRIHAAQEEQRKINRSLDIKLGELAETNVALYESNRLKSEFLANVTHELRTPLVSIIGFAELLRDAWEAEHPDRERLARYSENIRLSGRSLLDIINDLLDLAKLEAGKMDFHLSDFSIADLCGELVDFIRPLAEKREQDLQLIHGDALPPFHNDSGKIKQILYNLLSNAVKFTPAGGSIVLCVERSGEASVRMQVRDSGPGIPRNEWETIFEKFRQLDSSETREYPGTGLGLAITKELVQMLGGTVSVNSEEGHGAIFTVELPTRPQENVRRPQIALT